MARHGLRLDADFGEDTVAVAIACFLSAITFPIQRFTVEPFSRSKERWLGADARIFSRVAGFRPFYLQFKRPSAYPTASLAKIVKDRKQCTPSLTTSPRTLFFSLRKKQPHHSDFQHNILYRLRNRLRSRQLGDAAYVCPLFLSRSAYVSSFHLSALALWPYFSPLLPWSVSGLSVQSPSQLPTTIPTVPLISEHVCIPPHAPVLNAKHSYSFTESGSELCFHSPIALPEGVQPFGNWLGRIVQPRVEGWITQESAMNELKNLLKSDDPLSFSQGTFDASDGFAAWMDWGAQLERDYAIDQYAVIRWKDK